MPSTHEAPESPSARIHWLWLETPGTPAHRRWGKRIRKEFKVIPKASLRYMREKEKRKRVFKSSTPTKKPNTTAFGAPGSERD